MAYQFTYHAIKRAEGRGLKLERAKDLFEKAKRCALKSTSKRFYKLIKYGESQYKTEYWYNQGFLFIVHRKKKDFSIIITVINCKLKDIILYGKS